jgi:hypothetical protein
MARNEIHAIIAENSKFFQEFIGKPFTYASYAVHQKYLKKKVKFKNKTGIFSFKGTMSALLELELIKKSINHHY